MLLALGAALPLAFRSAPTSPVVDEIGTPFASLTPATADDGISAEPALSADGALLAVAQSTVVAQEQRAAGVVETLRRR